MAYHKKDSLAEDVSILSSGVKIDGCFEISLQLLWIFKTSIR